MSVSTFENILSVPKVLNKKISILVGVRCGKNVDCQQKRSGIQQPGITIFNKIYLELNSSRYLLK